MRATQPHRVNRAFGHVKLQARGAGNVSNDRFRAAERDRQRRLAGSTPPDRRLAAVRFLYICRRVVAPARRDRQLATCPGHQKAQSDRRREIRLARGLALVVRLLGQTGRLGHGVEVVVLVHIPASIRRRPGRDQEAGDVPVRRAFATRQLLGAEFMARPGSNQIELDGLDETRADFEGIDRSRLRGCHGRGVPYTEREARSPAPWFQTTDTFCDAERIVGLISVQAQSCRRLARTSNSSVPHRRQGRSPRVRGSHRLDSRRAPAGGLIPVRAGRSPFPWAAVPI